PKIAAMKKTSASQSRAPAAMFSSNVTGRPRDSALEARRETALEELVERRAHRLELQSEAFPGDDPDHLHVHLHAEIGGRVLGLDLDRQDLAALPLAVIALDQQAAQGPVHGVIDDSVDADRKDGQRQAAVLAPFLAAQRGVAHR